MPFDAGMRCLATLLLVSAAAFAQRQTENVLLVTLDGLRWQDVFTGADNRMINQPDGGVRDLRQLRREFYRGAPEVRRALLMPFLWGVVAEQGQLFGDPTKGARAVVTNPHKFSYPGYSELLTGFVDEAIDSNNKLPNPNVTVLEFLHGRPGFAGRVAAFSGWDVHEYIVNEARSGVFCEVAWEPVTVATSPQRLAELNRAATALPTDGTDLRRSLGIQRQRFLVFLPGGIRPVKGQHRAISAIPKLRAAGVDIEMIIAGASQDEAYAMRVRAEADDTPGVRVMPSLARERMGAAYADADVVLNTSLSEGAAPTILEAGMLGRPVIASDIPGNRALIRHNETGLLFADEESMAKQILALYRNRTAAGTLGVRVREDFMRRFSADREVAGLLSSYAAA